MAEVAHRALPFLKQLGVRFWIVGRQQKLIDERILHRDLFDYYLPWKIEKIKLEIKILTKLVQEILTKLVQEKEYGNATTILAKEMSKLLIEEQIGHHLPSSSFEADNCESISDFLIEIIWSLSSSINDFFDQTISSSLAIIKKLCRRIDTYCRNRDFLMAFQNLVDLQMNLPESSRDVEALFMDLFF